MKNNKAFENFYKLTKLEFVGLKARGILSPIGRHFP